MKPTQEQVISWSLKCGASIKTDCNGNGAFGSGVDLNALAALAYEAGRKDEVEIAVAEAYRCGYEAGRKDENEACAVEVAAIDADGWEFTMAAIIRARREQ